VTQQHFASGTGGTSIDHLYDVLLDHFTLMWASSDALSQNQKLKRKMASLGLEQS
jgi:hypothetical protein